MEEKNFINKFLNKLKLTNIYDLSIITVHQDLLLYIQ